MNHKNTLDYMTKHSYQRYARHLILPEIQLIGQTRLHKAQVLFIGAGGLASATLLYLVSSGLSTIGIVDDDIIEISNLHRQVIYSEEDIGLYKVDAAKRQLLKMNSHCDIVTYHVKLDNENAEDLIKLYDIIIDSTDNFETRYLLSAVCKHLHKVHIYGAISAFVGHLSVFNYQGGLSYNEMYHPDKKKMIRGCSREGVISVLPGLIGIMQATEIIKIITGVGQVLHEQMLAYDVLKTSFKIIRLHPIKICHKHLPIYIPKLKWKNQQPIPLIDIFQLYDYLTNSTVNLCLIDIRPNAEYQLSHLKGAISLPLNKMHQKDVLTFISIIAVKHDITIYCNSLARSYIGSDLLQKHNITHFILSLTE